MAALSCNELTLTSDTLIHRFAKESPLEKCARYCRVHRERRLVREYTPKDSRLQYKLPEDSIKIPSSTAVRNRPDDHTADILIKSDEIFGLSVYTWDEPTHVKMAEVANRFRLCFSATVKALGEQSLSVCCNGYIWIGNTRAKHCLVYPSSEMTLRDFDRSWKSVKWQMCHIEGEGGEKKPNPFWYPRPGTTQILWLENLLNIAILREDDPNDLTAVDLYSRVRRDDIKSLDDIVKNHLDQSCLQLLEFVLAGEEEYLTHNSESEEFDICEIILNGKSLVHFLKTTEKVRDSEKRLTTRELVNMHRTLITCPHSTIERERD